MHLSDPWRETTNWTTESRATFARPLCSTTPKGSRCSFSARITNVVPIPAQRAGYGRRQKRQSCSAWRFSCSGRRVFLVAPGRQVVGGYGIGFEWIAGKETAPIDCLRTTAYIGQQMVEQQAQHHLPRFILANQGNDSTQLVGKLARRIGQHF